MNIIKHIMRPLAFVALLGGMNAPAMGQDSGVENILDSACGMGAIADAKIFLPIFEGTWAVEHLAGVVMAGAMVLPFPGSAESENIELDLVDGWLEARHPEMPTPMLIGFANEMPFLFSEIDAENGMPPPGISRESIETEAGCNIAELPNLIGNAEVTVDGVVMSFIWRLWPVDMNNIVVIQHTSSFVHGMAVTSRRSVRLFRM